MTGMRSTRVQIAGSGIAALSIAQLLSQSGIPYAIEPDGAKQQRSVLLSSQTIQLLSAIHRTERFVQLGWPIQRRSVLWSDATEPVTVEHQGISISESRLTDEFRSRLRGSHKNTSVPASSGWLIETQLWANSGDTLTRYGERRTTFQTVTLRSSADSRCCFTESVSTGWLFLLPTSNTEAALLCTGYHPEEVLAESRLVARQMERASVFSTPVNIAPAMAHELTGPGLIRAGSAALRFDPLCGEGVGNAAREAYLAAAVLRAADRGEAVQGLLAHYATRLQQAFLRHLLVCRSFYDIHQETAFWRSELEHLETGIAAMQAGALYAPAMFRFEGLDLKPVTA